jgi:hypothetical protein
VPARPSKPAELASVQLWLTRVDGWIKFLENLKGISPELQDSWTRGMGRFYRKELDIALAHPPKGVQVQVKAFLVRLRKV